MKPDINFDIPAQFARLQQAVSLSRLSRCRIIGSGLGGSRSGFESLARSGVMNHTFIDGDTYCTENIATQHCFHDEVGTPKVVATAAAIRRINPQAQVRPLVKWLDEISDAEFADLIAEPVQVRDQAGNIIWEGPAETTLLCGFTDSFEAQARINRLALQFGIPSICAQMYHEGRGAEITFTLPGITPACHRDSLAGRYRAYLEQGFKNDVTSHGTPLCSTNRLNSLVETLALAILHHGSGHERWERLIERIGTRSLVQIRMDPDIGTSLGLAVFERVLGGGDTDRLVTDETVWLPQAADSPEGNGYPLCPDCGGTGELGNAKGTFADTRIMRQ